MRSRLLRAVLPALVLIGSVPAHGEALPPDEDRTTSEDARPTPKPRDWLVGGFDRTSRWVTGGLVVGLGGYLAFADTDDVRSLGDVTQMVPLVTATSLTLGTGDWPGVGQLALSGGTAFVLTHGIKEIVDKSRPNDSDDNSFPSGHTSAAFTGTAFVWRRYGPKWGAPLSVVAAYTGISRVRGQNHYADDVVSGAAIGLISNWLWTDPLDERVKMSLFPTEGGAGVSLTVEPSAPRRPGSASVEPTIPRRSFVWEIGGADVVRNDVSFRSAKTIDFRFDEENDPTATAFVGVAWVDPGSRYSVFAAFAPFEVRENFVAEEDVSFARQVIPDGTTVRSRYVANDYRLGAGYVAVGRPRLRFTVGGSLALFDTTVALSTADDASSERTTLVRPLLGARLGTTWGRRWFGFSTLNGWSGWDVKLVDFTAQVGFRPHPKWALSLGYRWVDRTVETDELENTAHRSQVALGVGYFW